MKMEEGVDQLFDVDSRREKIRKLKKQNLFLLPGCWVMFALAIGQIFISPAQGALGLIIFVLIFLGYAGNQSELRQILILERLERNGGPTNRRR